VRGEGAYLRNGAGERFTEELAPRDQVARAIARENRAGRGPVTLDLSHLDPDHVRSRFPRIAATCARYGVDLTKDPVPVTPAAHYVMGGVATDLSGRSTLPGLYAAGEAAGTGVHGANRLASNSLLEGLVFGARASEAMAEDPAPAAVGAAVADVSERPPSEAGREGDPAALVATLRARAWDNLGLERDGAGLRGFLAELAALGAQVAAHPRHRAAAEARNLVAVAEAMATCALFREESRGGHFRTDFPEPDDARFLGHTLLTTEGPRLIPVDAVAAAA